jgi:hypothetical protein
MKVHRPYGFVLNGSLPRTDLRSTYDLVAPAVDKMLDAVIEQKTPQNSQQMTVFCSK